MTVLLASIISPGRPERAVMSRAAHALVRLAAEEYFGTPCPVTVRLPGGKPDFAEDSGLHFSLSHSYGAVLAGVSDRPLGVDLELVREVNDRFARRLFSEKMLGAFGYYGGWTLRESAYKLGAPGHLMSMELEPADGPFAAAPGGAVCRSYDGLPGYACAAAAWDRSALPYELILVPPERLGEA